MASAIDTGKMMRSVSIEKGTDGRLKSGRAVGSAPMSPTRLSPSGRKSETTVSSRMATRGDGTAFVTRGRR